MQFTTEDWILIKHYRLNRNMHEFPNKPWSASGLDKLIRKIDDTGGTDRTNGSCRPNLWNQNIGHQTVLT